MNPTVSIVTPAFNADLYLRETAESVQAQTLRDWEWIVVDDGSTDGGGARLDSLAASDPRIRVIHQANSGVSVARNRGLLEATAPLVALLDADDVWLAENLSRKVDALQRDPSALYAFSNMNRRLESTGEIHPSAPGKGEPVLERLLLWDGEVIPGICSNLVFRRSLFEDGLHFDPNFSTAADLDFAFRLASRGRSLFLQERLFTYRVVGTSMSRNLGLLERDQVAVWRKASELGLFRSRGFRRRCFANLYMLLAGNWWIDGRDRRRGLYFLGCALLSHPPAAGGLLVRKALRRVGLLE